HVLVGDAAGCSPPRRWDVVRTELVYVDSGVRPALVRRLLREFVSPGGSLLVCRYGDRTETARPARRRTPRGAGLLGLLPRGRPHRHRRRRAGAHGRRGGAPPLTRGSSQATRPGSPRRNTGPVRCRPAMGRSAAAPTSFLTSAAPPSRRTVREEPLGSGDLIVART